MTAVTTAERPAAPTHPLIDDVTVAVLGGTYRTSALPGGLVALEVTGAPGGQVELRLAAPLRDAVGYWHPACGWERTLLPDWAGRTRTSLITSAPVGCLYDTSGATLLAFAAHDPVTETEIVFGVSEQSKLFVVHVHLTTDGSPYTLVLAPRSPSVSVALRRLREPLRRAAAPPLPVPDSALAPVYSTWYAFGQDVTAAAVEGEAALAAELGCGLLILDDGWQEYGVKRGYSWAGDWTVDTAKFPDLTAHVAGVRARGLAYLAWIAPLLLGPESRVFPRLGRLAPLPSPTAPGAYVLDPRSAEVREHVVATCARLVTEHGLDGLKIDFLDDAMVYPDASAAMAELLSELRAALESVRPGVLIELRQPYLGHGMGAFGNLLRATDCPADAVANRVRTVDAAMLSLGGAVHSDMLMWDPDGSAEAAARQLLNVLQAVPQISCRLDSLRPEHRESLAFWLGQWTRLSPILLGAEVEAGRPDELYPMITASHGGHQVILLHTDRVVPVDLRGHREIDLVNATSSARITLDVSGDRRPAEVTVRDARGRVVDAGTQPFTPGPRFLNVPPSGLATIKAVN